ncbi:MAG: DUF481 domain-containing protein [Pseudomonadota bacterium]
MNRLLVRRSGDNRALLFILLLLAMALSLTSPVASAHRKSDVITLYNGDRITGEIKSLLSGRLSLSTDAMGTISIEWKDIASVDSNYNYELRLTDGQRFFGSVNAASVPGTVGFEDVFGKKSFPWESVVELRPVEDSFVDRLDIYLSANYAFTKASDVTQTEFRANVSYEDENALNSLTSRATVSDTNDETTTSARVTVGRRVWTDRQRLYRTVFGGYETNDELALDYRFTLGAGFGRYFIDTNKSKLNGALALQALEEQSGVGETQESIEAVISLGYSYWHFDTPEVNLDLTTSVYPSLTEQGRVRADSTATLKWEIINDLFWDFSAWGSYDSSTIEEAAGEFDWGVTTGLGWNF